MSVWIRHQIYKHRFAARSWGYATGATGNMGGVFGTNRLNVTTPIIYDGDPKTHKYHSWQFRSSIQKRWGYWNTTLNKFNIPHNQP